jgi:bifunctional non-homologous end joining protein LigD
MIQAASDAGNAAGLVYFIFDLLHLDGDDVGARPLIERKARLAALLANAAPPLHYSDYHRGQGPAFHEQACKLQLEGIVSKRADAPSAPGNRGLMESCPRKRRWAGAGHEADTEEAQRGVQGEGGAGGDQERPDARRAGE